MPKVVVGNKLKTKESSSHKDQSTAKWQRFAHWVKEESTVTDWIMALFTVVIAVAAVLKWREMRGAGEQTNKLIQAANLQVTAANQIADASKRNAAAAESFSRNAGAINSGVSGAVDKLNLQAGALKDSVLQATRLAKATEQANKNVLDADRPWIGIIIDITGFEANRTPTKTIRLVNSGRRPALITSFKADGAYSKPVNENPSYKGETPVNRQFLVPGTQYVSEANLFVGSGILSTEALSLLNSNTTTFYSYAIVEYIDPRTGKKHFTHACMQYIPASQSEGRAAGFFGCQAYNDGD